MESFARHSRRRVLLLKVALLRIQNRLGTGEGILRVIVDGRCNELLRWCFSVGSVVAQFRFLLERLWKGDFI